MNVDPPLILIADDDRTIRMVVVSALESSGFRAIVASNGRQAVEIALREQPGLILMDVRMPDVDGFEAMRLLRADPRTARTPIMFLTAVAKDPHDVAYGLELGADDYLRKPFGLEELLARVNRKLRDRQMEERLQQRTHELEALLALGAQLNEVRTVAQVIDHLTNFSLQYLPASTVCMMLAGADGNRTIWCRREPEGEYIMHYGPLNITEHILVGGDTLLLNNHEALVALDPMYEKADLSAMMGAPLIHHGQALGVLLVGHPAANSYTENMLRLLRSFAEQGALALRNAQLHEELQGYITNLEAKVEARTAELVAAQQHLAYTEKLAAIGTLAAGVAHEVNNPLQPILTTLELMLEDTEAGLPIDAESISVAYSNVRRIESMVRLLLDFARPEQQILATVDLNTVVEEVLALTGKQFANDRITIKRELNALPTITANADQLKQVVLNLMLNARDAMPNGGVLTLATGEEPTAVVLSIRDTGIGIPASNIPRIFDPFYTTKSEGTGMGLAVSYSIIEAHGGQIKTISEDGHGTEFIIHFPRAGEAINR